MDTGHHGWVCKNSGFIKIGMSGVSQFKISQANKFQLLPNHSMLAAEPSLQLAEGGQESTQFVCSFTLYCRLGI